MKRQTGFTLIELMVVIVMLGILAGTGVGFMAKYRQRTIGSEALVMMKQILEGEIMYFLEHDQFFPKADPLPADPPISVWHDGRDPSAADQQRALDALKVFIPTGHLLDFTITSTGTTCAVTISSAGNFNLFPGAKQFTRTVDDKGKIQ